MDFFNTLDHTINPVQFLRIFDIKVFIGKEHMFMCDNGAVVYSTGPVNSYLDTCCVVPRGP